ncbi:hypothetical protein RQP46_010023 [Phenoliferia psychrophenolica]
MVSPTRPAMLKLLALPLTRSGPQPPLFYLHAVRPPPSAVKTADLSYASRATNKAADVWSQLGQANEGSWKRKAYMQGERFMDRIEYEEWALKAIDPALSPTPWSTPGTPKEGDDGKVTLLYPPSMLSEGPLLDALKAQLAHREPHHKSAMIKCLVGAPLTFPFAIVPIVPNFPLFYVLWRAWSHWRAWKASSYLNSLLTASQINLEPSASLDSVYAPTSSPSSTSSPDLLLTLDTVPKIVKAFKLNEDEASELRRAVQQAKARLAQGASKDHVAPGEQASEGVQQEAAKEKKAQ